MSSDKTLALRRMRYWATGLLALVSGLFALSLVLPQVLTITPAAAPWWGLGRAVLEAAMVGALADWFAVVALFRPITIPLLGRALPHTAIIPKNKDKIADNLAIFVRDKFLDADSLIRLLRQHDVAQMLSAWLQGEANQARLAHYLARWLQSILALAQEEPIQRLLHNALRGVLAKLDLAPVAGTILDSLTQEQRHQALLDEVIHQLAILLADADTQALLAGGLGGWFKEEYPLVEKLVSADWIGAKGAALTIAAASRLLSDINQNAEHPLRARFDAFTQAQIEKLKTSPEFHAKGEAIKAYIQNDPVFIEYVQQIWHSLQAWLIADLEKPDANSNIQQGVRQSTAWLGKVLAEDATLQASFNQHLAEFAEHLAPEFAEFFTKHIRNTVKSWDAQTLSQQIEWNIGRDLQFIRINGTIIGGLIGGVLYLVQFIPLGH